MGDRTHSEHSLSPPKNRFRLSLPGAEKVRPHTLFATDLSARTYIGLPDEVQMLKDMTRTFAEQELAPIAGKIDKESVKKYLKKLI